MSVYDIVDKGSHSFRKRKLQAYSPKEVVGEPIAAFQNLITKWPTPTECFASQGV